MISAPAERLFAYVDDIRNLARHMTESRSMPMMGSRLTLEIVTREPTGVGATYRYAGQTLGFVLDFSETVTRYVAGREKIWRTIGTPKLLIMRGYEMRVLVELATPATTNLTISIDYELPDAGFCRIAGWLLGDAYCRWCLTGMVDGSKRDLERQGGPAMITASEANWLQTVRRYFGVSLAANFVWEILQLPLFTLWTTGTLRQQAFAVFHCTIGDVMIAALSLLAALVLVAQQNWPRSSVARVFLLSLAVGLGYTIYSEWLNTSVRGNWAYSQWMPTLPLLGTGLAPLMQWLIVPTLAQWFSLRRRPWSDT